MRLVRSIEKIISQVIRMSALAAIVILGLMMMLTVLDVTLRYLFARPIPGSMELTEYLMVCAGTLGLAWCALHLAHIKVDLIVGRLPQKAQKVIDSINYFLLMCISGLLAWQLFSKSTVVRELGVASSMLEVPQYPFVLVAAFSYFLLFLASIMLLTYSMSSLISKVLKK